MAPQDEDRPDKPEDKKGSRDRGTQRRKTAASRSRKSPAARQKQTSKIEVPFSHETLIRRLRDARGTALVVLGARAIGGALISILLAAIIVALLSIVMVPLQNRWLMGPASLAVAAGLVFAAHIASVRTIPEIASVIGFLHDRAFVWVDPFRDEKPHLLPFWLEAALWAPTQVLAGAVPFLRIHQAPEADLNSAADVSRRMVEQGELDFTEGVASGTADESGLRLLLLLRLSRLAIEDGRLKGRISSLGHTVLFEGALG